MRKIACRKLKIPVELSVDDKSALKPEGPEPLGKIARLDVRRRCFIQNHDRAVLRFGRQCVSQTKGAHLFRQVELVTVIDWTHGLGAADEQRRRTRAVPGLARTLLLVEFLLGLIDLAPSQ